MKDFEKNYWDYQICLIVTMNTIPLTNYFSQAKSGSWSTVRNIQFGTFIHLLKSS